MASIAGRDGLSFRATRRVPLFLFGKAGIVVDATKRCRESYALDCLTDRSAEAGGAIGNRVRKFDSCKGIMLRFARLLRERHASLLEASSIRRHRWTVIPPFCPAYESAERFFSDSGA